ncbi:O-antigen ligase family protein [Sinomicrobium sp. M5D2P17]
MKNLSYIIKDNGYVYGACLFAFLLPFNQFVSTFAIVLWLLLSITSLKKENINKNRLLGLFPLLYILYGISLLYSQNESFYILERKLSLIIFPLLFFLHKYHEHQRKAILRMFIYGLMISGLLCLMIAIFKSSHFENGVLYFKANVEDGRGFIESIMYGGNYFFGNYFSVFHQTVYYAIYLCVGVAILLWGKRIFEKKTRTALLFFFIMLLFLISNKASYLVLFAILLIKLTFTDTLTVKRKFIIIITVLIVSIAFNFVNPRMGLSLRKILTKGIELEKTARYDYKLRLLSWDAAITLIKEEPVIGYGVGDAQDYLNDVYEQNGYVWPFKWSLNAHNEYLQLWIETGIFGVVIFLIILFVLLRHGIYNHRNSLALSIFIIFFMNALFESYLNRYSGISFFSFMYCFIISAFNYKPHVIKN